MLNKLGYIHSMVNHSVEFEVSDGTCTNTIESTQRAVKNNLPKNGIVKDLYDRYLSEYCIRKNYLNDYIPSQNRYSCVHQKACVT